MNNHPVPNCFEVARNGRWCAGAEEAAAEIIRLTRELDEAREENERVRLANVDGQAWVESMMRLTDAGAWFEFLKHGEQDHQDWMREAIQAFIDDKPKPEPRGLGRHGALIAKHEARIAELEARLAWHSVENADFPTIEGWYLVCSRYDDAVVERRRVQHWDYWFGPLPAAPKRGGEMMACKFCGGSHTLPEYSERCELAELRALRDRILKWPSTPVDFKAELVHSGRAELHAALVEIRAIVMRAQELAAEALAATKEV